MENGWQVVWEHSRTSQGRVHKVGEEGESDW